MTSKNYRDLGLVEPIDHSENTLSGSSYEDEPPLKQPPVHSGTLHCTDEGQARRFGVEMYPITIPFI